MKTERFWQVATLLCVLFFLAGATAVLGQEEMTVKPTKVSGDYRIGAGDLLQVVVWKNDDVSGEFRVRPDGKFSMPLIGDILAGDSTTDSISMQVEQKLKLFIEAPHVSIIVTEASSNRIYVMGEVANPGSYAIDGDLSVLQALAVAGGFTEFANREKMILIRGLGEDQKNISLSYSKILKETGEDFNPVLVRGDTLVVP